MYPCHNQRKADENEKIIKNSSVMKIESSISLQALVFCLVGATFKKLTNRGIHFINPPRDKGNKITAFFNGLDNISVELIQPLN